VLSAPYEAVAVVEQKGRVNSDIFLAEQKVYVRHVHPSLDSPSLLCLGCHSSHKDLQAIRFARHINVYVSCTPPQTAHKLHPSEPSWNRSKAQTYSGAWSSWMRRNPGLRIHVYDIAGLVNEAFVTVCWMELARNGLLYTGCIYWIEMFVWIYCLLNWRTFLHLQMSEPLKMKWLTFRRRQQAVTVTCGSHEEYTTSWSRAAEKETLLEVKYLP
jgi:hypothetical protein